MLWATIKWWNLKKNTGHPRLDGWEQVRIVIRIPEYQSEGKCGNSFLWFYLNPVVLSWFRSWIRVHREHQACWRETWSWKWTSSQWPQPDMDEWWRCSKSVPWELKPRCLYREQEQVRDWSEHSGWWVLTGTSQPGSQSGAGSRELLPTFHRPHFNLILFCCMEGQTCPHRSMGRWCRRINDPEWVF